MEWISTFRRCVIILFLFPSFIIRVDNLSVFRSDILPESGCQLLPLIPDAKPCEEQGATEVKDSFFPILVTTFFEQCSKLIW
jgi:hypothetical protein